MWGDMLVAKRPEFDPQNRYTASCKDVETEQHLLQMLDHRMIIADWQYHPEHFPVETASVFKQKGFECLLCPWDTSRNHIKVMTETVKEEQLMGLLHTTWHTLSKGLRYVLVAAVYSFEYGDAVASFNTGTYAAALMRKVMPAKGDYRKAGWSKAQIGFLW